MNTYTITERTANGGRKPDSYYLLGEYLFSESSRTLDGFFYAGHHKITKATGISRSTHGDYIAMLANEGYVQVVHTAGRRFVRWLGDVNTFRANYAVVAQAQMDTVLTCLAEYLYFLSQQEGIFRLGAEVAATSDIAAPVLDDYLDDLEKDGFLRIYRVGTARFAEWIGSLEDFYERSAA